MSPTRSPSPPKHAPPEPPREPDIVLPFATTTSTPTPANETDTISGGSCITTLYDADGDLTTDAAGNTYAYDAWNRLISVTNASSVVVASYAYDGLGRCITETNTTGTYDYYYNETNQVVETDVRTGTGDKVYQQFVWDPRAADTPLEMTQFNADGYATNSYFYMQDANGNVTGLVDGTGAVVERYAYDAYGNVTVYGGDSWSTQISASAVSNPILYQGMQWDAATGLYRTPNRYYSPVLQTWISRDPAGYAGSPGNLYDFCRNGPVSRIDPSGLVDYDVDSQQLFHFRNADGTFGVQWDAAHDWHIVQKSGHTITKKEIAAAETAFKKLISNPKEQQKMIAAVNAARAKMVGQGFKNVEFLGPIATNLQRTFRVVMVAAVIYKLSTILKSPHPGAAAVAMGKEELISTSITGTVGVGALWATGGTLSAGAALSVGSLVIAAGCAGSWAGTKIAETEVSGHPISEYIGRIFEPVFEAGDLLQQGIEGKGALGGGVHDDPIQMRIDRENKKAAGLLDE